MSLSRVSTIGMTQTPRDADLLVATEGCYVAIWDEASPVNRVGFMDEAWALASETVRRMGKEEHFSLFALNQRLMELSQEGALLSWTVLFDGVFRAMGHFDLQAASSAPLAPANLGAAHESGILVCPTGRLILGCMGQLGQLRAPFLVLEPGVYNVIFERDDDQEIKHSFLPSASKYPAGDGPDWQLWIQRVESDEERA